jgi:hypothetical protein
MKDETIAPPFYVGSDEADQPTIGEKVSESVRKATETAGAAYDEARKPGMPLSILANVVREAPLGSLLVAFLLGVAVARRR